MKVIVYNSNYYQKWNDFVAKAKNATFLFHRDFMEYHKDRFIDFSLLVIDNNERLQAIVPANMVDHTVYSHQGLSYGGILITSEIRIDDYVKILTEILRFLNGKNISDFYIKELPHIYTKTTSGELEFVLGKLNAKLIKTDSYYIIDNAINYKPNRNRARAIKKASINGLKITYEGIEKFWEILSKNLNNRYNTQPTHSISEIKYLMGKFPEDIEFIGVDDNGVLKAGVVLFLTNNVAHFQYSSGTKDRAETGALDMLFDHIILKYRNKRHISFGSSSTDSSLKINRGLSYWKESFGADLIPQRTFSIITALNKIEDIVFQKE